jgi:hypothetical protein
MLEPMFIGGGQRMAASFEHARLQYDFGGPSFFSAMLQIF